MISWLDPQKSPLCNFLKFLIRLFNVQEIQRDACKGISSATILKIELSPLQRYPLKLVPWSLFAPFHRSSNISEILKFRRLNVNVQSLIKWRKEDRRDRCKKKISIFRATMNLKRDIYQTFSEMFDNFDNSVTQCTSSKETKLPLWKQKLSRSSRSLHNFLWESRDKVSIIDAIFCQKVRRKDPRFISTRVYICAKYTRTKATN